MCNEFSYPSVYHTQLCLVERLPLDYKPRIMNEVNPASISTTLPMLTIETQHVNSYQKVSLHYTRNWLEIVAFLLLLRHGSVRIQRRLFIRNRRKICWPSFHFRLYKSRFKIEEMGGSRLI